MGTEMATAAEAQVQAAGQSASVLQVVTFGWQVPGYEVELVQTGGETTPASTMTGGGETGIGAWVPPPLSVAVPLPEAVPLLGATPPPDVLPVAAPAPD